MITLTNNQKILLEALQKSGLVSKFYWTGGTLLAVYYLQHRYSYDLDFFSEQPFSYQELIPFIHLVKKTFSITEIEEHKIYDRWEFIIPGKEKTRIEFVYYNHEKKRLRPLDRYLEIPIDSLEDIAANKVMAYFDRTEPKDLFDIYFLIQKGDYTVSTLLSLVKKKFDASFSEFMFWGESAKSLNLLSSLQLLIPTHDRSKQKKILQEVQAFFLEEGSNYLKTALKD